MDNTNSFFKFGDASNVDNSNTSFNITSNIIPGKKSTDSQANPFISEQNKFLNEKQNQNPF